jgi:hypothetical protein
MNEAQKAQLVSADEDRYSCYHMRVVYGIRAAQLTRWKRILAFIGLGVAPGILLVVINKPVFREAGLVVSGLCSSAAYVWAIFGYAFHWERQLEVSRKASSTCSSLYNRMRSLIAVARDPSSDAATVQQSLKALAEAQAEREEIIKEIDGSGTDVKPWMTLSAQQQTMVDLHTACRVCGKSWDKTKHKLLTAKEAKRFCKEPGQLACATCGLAK